MKKEIEILFRLNEDKDSVIKKFNDLKSGGNKRIVDTYYFDPLRDDLKPDQSGRLKASFRLREKDGKSYITYKNDHFNGDIWSHSDEYEVEVQDVGVIKNILENLGMKVLVVVDVEKNYFTDDIFEVVIEDVKNLGQFIEVEYHFNESTNISEAKENIRKFLDDRNIDIGEEMNSGKPELLLKKLNNVV